MKLPTSLTPSVLRSKAQKMTDAQRKLFPADLIASDTYLTNHLIACPAKLRLMIADHHRDPRTIVDFGCGHGVKTIAMARAYPQAEVIGIDITDAHKRALQICQNKLDGKVPDNLSFRTITPGTPLATVCKPDVIYSWSVLEHVSRALLPSVIADMFDGLQTGGLVVTQIAPLFFSPFGSHLKEFCDTKWIHLLDSHMELRNRILASATSTGATGSVSWMFERYEDLNRITADELADTFTAAGFSCQQDHRRKVRDAVPPQLAKTYPEDVLQTFELNFVHRKGPAA